jgi:hypothetical protein
MDNSSNLTTDLIGRHEIRKGKSIQISMLQNLSQEGRNLADMCRVLNRSPSTVRKVLKKFNIPAAGYNPRAYAD